MTGDRVASLAALLQQGVTLIRDLNQIRPDAGGVEIVKMLEWWGRAFEWVKEVEMAEEARGVQYDAGLNALLLELYDWLYDHADSEGYGRDAGIFAERLNEYLPKESK